MDLSWITISSSLSKGVIAVNQLADSKFEQYIRRIVTKVKIQSTDIFTPEELQKLEILLKVESDTLLLSIKTLIYVFKRMLKFIFMPVDLKRDLLSIGFSSDKSECIVKVWSAETKATLSELDSKEIDMCTESLNFSWKLNAELSSDPCKKSKTPKVYLALNDTKGATEIELTHPELHALFLQFESIQNEMDNILL